MTDSSMRIAVVNLTSGGFSGGYVKYLGELLPRLRSDERVSALAVASPASAVDASDWVWPEDDARHGRRALRHWLESWRPDVVFVPTARSFDTGGIPLVTMVRNMEPLVIPFSAPTVGEKVRNLARRLAARRAAMRATRVIAVSEYVRDYLVDRWHIDPRRVGMVRHGVRIPRPDENSPVPALQERPANFGIFAAGSVRPARGIEDLFDALAILRARGSDASLWFAGTPTPGAEPYARRLRERASALGVSDRIVWLGNLNAAQMRWCFSRARAFVMTSRVEACPNTVLEALASGARSISTRLPPMPEFFGDAASYYDAGDGPDLAAALERVHTETPEQSSAYRERSIARAACFSWETTARRTIDELALARTSRV